MTFNILTLFIEKWIPFDGETISNNQFLLSFQDRSSAFCISHFSHTPAHTDFVFCLLSAQWFVEFLHLNCAKPSLMFSFLTLAHDTDRKRIEKCHKYLPHCAMQIGIQHRSKIRKRHIERSWVGTFEMLNGNDNRQPFAFFNNNDMKSWKYPNKYYTRITSPFKSNFIQLKTWNSHLRPTTAA